MISMRALRPAGWTVAGLLLACAIGSRLVLQRWNIGGYVDIALLAFAIYAVGAWLCISGRLHAAEHEPRALIAILLIAVLLRVIALSAPQALSTDIFRYVWDGRVQAAGINPFRYLPVDPALAALRDPEIYPNINRANYAHTIYPPAAQLFFLAVERLHDSRFAMRLALTACEAITVAALISLLRSHKLPSTRVLIYAWHPLPIWEFAGSGHVDALMIAMSMTAFAFAARGRPAFAGAGLALAALVKFFPLTTLPALYRRGDWKLPLALIAIAALLYLPYLSAGDAVFGFLSGYTDEEGLRDGSGLFPFALLRWLLPAVPASAVIFYLAACAAVLVALAWASLRAPRSAGDVDITGGLRLATATLIIASPHLAWYFAWLIPFLCLRPSPAVFWLTGLAPVIYLSAWRGDLSAGLWIYGPALVLLIFSVWARRHPSSIRASDPKAFTENRHVDPARKQTAI